MARQQPGKLKNYEDKIIEVAKREGRQEAYNEILTHLQEKYLSDELRDPKTPEGSAILELAREVGELLRSKLRGSSATND